VADLGHSEGVLLAGGELVSTLLCEHPPEHQIIHLELSAMHEPLAIALEFLEVSCVLNSILPSSLVDEIDIFTPELILCGFIVCLDT
jgi:hypothetical protein